MVYGRHLIHFNHANIIKYCKRPQYNPDDFDANGRWLNNEIKQKRAHEMDEAIIKAWNDVVSPNDIVFHLGDFCFGDKFHNYLNRLNGFVNFIDGNHDNFHRLPARGRKFRMLGPLYTINQMDIPKQITLCHYKMYIWDKSHRGSWHLYGHSHGTANDSPTEFSIDVGIDVHSRPISFDEVAMYMAKKTFKPIDHHGE